MTMKPQIRIQAGSKDEVVPPNYWKIKQLSQNLKSDHWLKKETRLNHQRSPAIFLEADFSDQ